MLHHIPTWAMTLGRLLRAALAIMLLTAPLHAANAEIVTYKFSGLDPDVPVSGSISFHSTMAILPPRDEWDSWIDYRPTGLLTMTVGGETWSNAKTPSDPCGVRIHYGHIEMSFQCLVMDGDVERGAYFSFIAETGSNFSWEPDPTGPFAPLTFSGHKVYGFLYTWDSSQEDPWRTISLRLDEVTIGADEPPMAAILMAMGLAWSLARRTRSRRRST